MSRGYIGCFLSHYMLWNALQYTPEDEWLILEDDCAFQGDFREEFAKSYSQLPPDWQFVFVGGCCEQVHQVISPRVALGSSMCTHAYMVRRSALATLLEETQKVCNHLDILLLEKVLPQLRSYLFVPFLARQHTLDGKWPSMGHTE